ncbi:U3 small nucleolar RNA-associated protein 6-like protein [Rhynchospora pubera]|uniref:U3 small nucleolar RNA-associated protein 6-like protein n=1 Tax=Rhynchospora pubera TaxID=906938 RepID=A0AAV8CC33_9POAL|nr:U3 small nucleolar RNA-associated protein 6-like protein [Rhynchospora pubera]
MGDVVQVRLERMAEEVEDLERRGLFSRAELDSIVRRRRDFEFRLKRPSPLKSDFLAYVDYERSLEALRLLRKRTNNTKRRTKSKSKSKSKRIKSISDWAGVSRILTLYKSAASRFKGDLSLWFSYLEFCRQVNHTARMKKALADAIRFHPKVPGLWIYAAAWEFDHNLNVDAARALMQSGLRSCPQSHDLWIEFLRMELTFLAKLRARKLTLGHNMPTGTDKWKEENSGDSFMALSTEAETTSTSSEDPFWKKGLLMLRIIYRGAVDAVPDSFHLRKRFLEILSAAYLGDTDQLNDEIMADLRRDFSKDEAFWDWLARLQIGDVKDLKALTSDEAASKIKKAAEVYKEAVKKMPTGRMFSFYAKFWTDVLCEPGLNVLPESGCDEFNFASSLVKVYQQAESSGCLTERLACDYVRCHVEIGNLKEARELAERLCSGSHFSGSGELWVLRASVELKWVTFESSLLGKETLESLLCIVKRTAEKVPVSEAEDLWLLALKIFLNDKGYFEKLVKIAVFAIAKSSGSGTAIARAIISSALQKDGIRHARDMYKRFVSLPRPSLELFKFCIEIEFNLASFGNDCSALANVRKLYESAVGFYPQDKELWREYYIMETKVGTSETANAVYWRARKTLKADLNSM